MISKDKEKYSELFKKATDFLENAGYQNIKADFEGMESPKSYLVKSRNTNITPDIVAEKNGTKYVFELGLKSEKKRELVTKWMFLKTLSQIKDFKFRVISSRGHIKFANDLIAEVNIIPSTVIKI